MNLLAGDIILSTKSTIFSFLIRRETMSRFSHCRVMISPRNFVEAKWPMVRIGSLSEVTEKHIVMRHKDGITEKEMYNMAEFLTIQVGRHYGWQSVINRLLHYRLFSASQPDCSALVATAYAWVGKKLVRKDTVSVTPQDLYQSMELLEVR